MALKKTRDHWSFLEEIEAPLWVDLALDSENYSQDASEEWFNTTHLFHQYSSRHLKSTIFHPPEGTVTSDFDLQGPFSPKLPSSVSRSRGKDYRGNNLECHNSDQMSHLRQSKEVLGKKSVFAKPGSQQQEMRPRSSVGQSKGSSIWSANVIRKDGISHPLKAVATSKSSATSRVKNSTSTINNRTSGGNTFEKNQRQQQRSHSLKPAATSKSSATTKVMSSTSIKNISSSNIHFEKNHPQQKSSHPLKPASVSRNSATSTGMNCGSPNDSGTSTITSEHNLRNPQEELDISSRLCDSSVSTDSSVTIKNTFESNQPQQQKPLQVSGQAFGDTSRLLAIMRSSLRKSCVTRQASRIELKRDVGQTRGSGSSRKSSVSSSSNPCDDASLSRLTETGSNDSTAESRCTVRNNRTTKSLIILSDVSKIPATFTEERRANSSNGGGSKFAKPAGETVTKSKGQLTTSNAKALQPLREKKQQSSLSSTVNKGSTRSSKLKTLPTKGKENAIGKAATTASCSNKTTTNARLNCGQKGKEQHVSVKSDKRMLADSKAKHSAQTDGRACKDETQKVARFASCSNKKSICNKS